MKNLFVATNLGDIFVAVEEGGTGTPIIYLHGLFLDKTLWSNVRPILPDRTQVFIDMPSHGRSNNVGREWAIDECVEMLIRIMDELGFTQCIAIGHSWGSMTALRAAIRYPERFAALGLFNMPFKRTGAWRRVGFILQTQLVAFPKFYARQAAKALYSKKFLQEHPELGVQMEERLAKCPSQEIARMIRSVVLKPADATALITALQVPALAVVGETDYVGIPPKIAVITVPGGHISPHEAEEDTRKAIKQVLCLPSSSMQSALQPNENLARFKQRA